MMNDLPSDIIKKILDIISPKPKSLYDLPLYLSKFLFQDDQFNVFFIKHCVKGKYFDDILLYLIKNGKTNLVKIFLIFHKKCISKNLYRKALRNGNVKDLYILLSEYVSARTWFGYAVPWSAWTGDLELFKKWYLVAVRKNINPYKLIQHSLKYAIDKNHTHCVEWILNEISSKHSQYLTHNLFETWDKSFYSYKKEICLLLLHNNFSKYFDESHFVKGLELSAARLDLDLLKNLCEKREINWNKFGIKIFNCIYDPYNFRMYTSQKIFYDRTVNFLLNKLIENHRLGHQIEKNMILQYLYKGSFFCLYVDEKCPAIHHILQPAYTLKIISGMSGLSYAS